MRNDKTISTLCFRNSHAPKCRGRSCQCTCHEDYHEHLIAEACQGRSD